jgi:NAD(P)-dependent dehydrogenase (short-subunit alcohol dehydrogenase family)
MKTVLITGANRGIGLEHARRYLDRGARVFAAVRDLQDVADLKALKGAGTLELIGYDARSSAAPDAVKAATAGAPLDLLLCNAGVYGGDHQRLQDLDEAGFLDTIRVNTLAPLKLAEALADQVAASDRKVIATQSSLMGSIADNGTGGYYAYRASKAALNMATKCLALDLGKRGISVVALHPGWVRTRMGGPNAPVSTEDCVAGQQALLDRAGAKENGGFFNFDGKPLPW